MNNFLTEYENLKIDSDRMNLFVTASLKSGKRVCPALNTNFRNLSQWCKFICEVAPITSYTNAHKQHFEQLWKYDFKSLQAQKRPVINNHTKQRVIVRTNISEKAKNYFSDGEYSCFVPIIIYILLLLDNENNPSDVYVNGMHFLDSIPKWIKLKIMNYTKNIKSRDKYDPENVLQNLVVLYGDTDLFNSFVEWCKVNFPDETKINNLIVDDHNTKSGPISKRITNLQLSTLKEEAHYISLLFTLNEFIKTEKIKGLISGNKLNSGIEFINKFLDYLDNFFDSDFSWLGQVRQDESIEKLKVFINSQLNKNEQEELVNCIKTSFNLTIPESEEEE